MKRTDSIYFSIVAGVILAGCNSNTDDEVTDSGPPPARVIEFKGKVDDRFVGKWKSTSQDIAYDFGKDGKFTYKGVVYSPGGANKIDSSGDWAVEGEELFVRSAANSEVSNYTFKIEGKDLKLTTTGRKKLKFLYKKVG